MFFIIVGFILLLVGLVSFFARFSLKNSSQKSSATLVMIVTTVLGIVSLAGSSITMVAASTAGVTKEFGAVKDTVLLEGAHFIVPWFDVVPVYLGQQVGNVKGSQASSKDLQSVHSDLVVNFTVADPLNLYKINTSLNYPGLIVEPAIQEVFKAIVSKYTAEELITQRDQVSIAITTALSTKLKPYFLSVQTVNLTNFGFSQSFNASIEEKVTASQKAATAQRNLERIEFEAQARVTAAKGEAEAIRIQVEAIQNQGGEAYTQLKAIEKWDGKLPATMAGTIPFVNVK